MTVYSWFSQTLVKPTDQEIRLVDNDGGTPSPFTGYMQTLVRPKYWRMSCTWKNISGGERADIIAFFLQLNGKEHRVRMPFFGQVQRGELGGTPVVDGGSQTGNSINIRGASTSQTDWIKAGDIFRIGSNRQLRVATADADSDVSGDVAVSFVPELRDSPSDAETINVSASNTGIWILETPVSFVNSSMQRRGDSTLYSDLTLDFIDDIAYA